ncbi:helix-turn-helix transcriptional regulator [Mangrovivirga sp. M17]|uniref:Helix-turn-helix transcriptional regulator n=1 Tax=Mangrovivirga halotolerans TaxID=2993936 RepID=A0ABT3RUT3_9BACT|nr:helix-turn-helix transcriptional regulator [Mangrovivirga halotolerans]MCX2745541.1 helix-turn-helix transcriptional regulator [Mangrovivirga halotolerans]
MNSVARKIILTRKEKGITQEELAEKSKVNIRTIQRIENCENEPRGKTLQLICEVLDLNPQAIIKTDNNTKVTNRVHKFINLSFLILLNCIIAGIYGYLTIDTEANLNSRIGAFILSIVLPLFIVTQTIGNSGINRMLKFGSGLIIYFLSVIVLHGFPIGFTSGLFPCLLTSLAIFYYGHELIKNK